MGPPSCEVTRVAGGCHILPLLPKPPPGGRALRPPTPFPVARSHQSGVPAVRPLPKKRKARPRDPPILVPREGPNF